MFDVPAFSRRNFLLSISAVGALGVHLSAQANNSPQDEIWTDAARDQRQVPALVRWPAQTPLGVLVFSHGLGGHREGADVWGHAWAKAGFVVVHLQHAGSDAASLRGGLFSIRKASSQEQFVARVSDVKFAIDEIERRRTQKTGRWGEIPAGKLGVAGHSFGARTSMALAGFTYPRTGGWSGADPRIKAFIALSPALGKYATLEQGRKDAKAITRPMLVVSGSLDGEVVNNGETVESRRMVYDALPEGKKALLWIEDADHFTFAGNETPIRGNFLLRRPAVSEAAEVQHHAVVADATTQWWLAQLHGEALSAPKGLAAQDIWLKG
jgi:predicted dienelactone hydrolase